jgi:hypothetical protein
MFRQPRRTHSLGSWIALLILAAAGSGCGPASTPEAVAIAATPLVTLIKNPDVTEVGVGGEVAIAAEVTGVNPQFTWHAQRGTLSRTEGPSVIYKAPGTPGEDMVDLTVSSNGVTTTRSINFHVVAPTPTPPPTPTAMDQLTETPTLMRTPTLADTPTPAPTESLSTDTPTPPRGGGTLVIELDPADFKIQDGDGDGIAEEFFLDTRFGAIPGLPVQDGVDLSNYDLEFTFEARDGQEAQLWYKGRSWKNVFSFPYPITFGQPIRYDPFSDGRNVDEFSDFSHIWGVGAKIWGGVEGVQITSARLIQR